MWGFVSVLSNAPIFFILFLSSPKYGRNQGQGKKQKARQIRPREVSPRVALGLKEKLLGCHKRARASEVRSHRLSSPLRPEAAEKDMKEIVQSKRVGELEMVLWSRVYRGCGRGCRV